MSNKSYRLLKEYISFILKETDWTQFSSSSADDDNDPVMNALGALGANSDGMAAIQADKQKKSQERSDILSVNKQALFRKGINVDKLQRLGEGAGGIAFAIDDKRVLKVTGDAAEARSSNSLRGKNLKGIVSIYDIWKFPNSNLYGIVMERITVFKEWPNDNLKQEIEEIVDTFGLKQLLQKYKGNMEQIWQVIDKSPLHMPNVDKNSLKQAFQVLANAVNTLKQAGIQNFFDLHLDNLGKRLNGEIVLFDIGFAGGGSEPPVLGTS